MRENFVPVADLFLEVRFSGEVHDVREFITPNQWHVRQKIEELRNKWELVTPEVCWEYVCADIQYPLDIHGKANEYHRLDSYAFRQYFVPGMGWFVRPWVKQVVYDEWFDFPAEILSMPKPIADCDGSSILLCSLLEAIGIKAYVALGGFAGQSDHLTHAWVLVDYKGDWQVWETTTPEAGLAMPEANDYYIPLVYFNDKEILLDPTVYGMLEQMNYIPSVGSLFAPFGFVCDSCKKIQCIRQLGETICRVC